MNLYRTTDGLVVRDENAQSWRLAEASWDGDIAAKPTQKPAHLFEQQREADLLGSR